MDAVSGGNALFSSCIKVHPKKSGSESRSHVRSVTLLSETELNVGYERSLGPTDLCLPDRSISSLSRRKMSTTILSVRFVTSSSMYSRAISKGLQEIRGLRTMLNKLSNLVGRGLTRLLTATLTMYKYAISPWLPMACRFHPTCSTYAVESLQRFGLLKGTWLASRRVCRCHPYSKGGFDPVPDAAVEPLNMQWSQTNSSSEGASL